MKRNLVYLTTILLISFLFFQNSAGQADSAIFQRKITIAGVGDIMLGSTFTDSGMLPPHDNPFLLLGNLADTLASFDITV